MYSKEFRLEIGKLAYETTEPLLDLFDLQK